CDTIFHLLLTIPLASNIPAKICSKKTIATFMSSKPHVLMPSTAAFPSTGLVYGGRKSFPRQKIICFQSQLCSNHLKIGGRRTDPCLLRRVQIQRLYFSLCTILDTHCM